MTAVPDSLIPEGDAFPARAEAWPSDERVLQYRWGATFLLTQAGGQAFEKLALLSSTAEQRLAVATRFQPTLLWMQVQNAGIVTPEELIQLHKVVKDPRFVTVLWNGDITMQNSLARYGWYVDLGRHVSLVTHVSLPYVQDMRKRGLANAAYLQIGYSPDHWFESADAHWGQDYDVVFLYNKYTPSLKASIAEAFGRYDGMREALHVGLRNAFGQRALLGARAPLHAGLFALGCYHRSHFAVSCSGANNLERTTSNRLLFTLASGACVLVKRFPGWESFGLKHGENCFVFDTVPECIALIREGLKDKARTRAVGKAGAALAREHHTWAVRLRELAPLVAAVRGEALTPA